MTKILFEYAERTDPLDAYIKTVANKPWGNFRSCFILFYISDDCIVGRYDKDVLINEWREGMRFITLRVDNLYNQINVLDTLHITHVVQI